jgi:phosphoglycolate phosphatase-like HAD superfamily hydrolase
MMIKYIFFDFDGVLAESVNVKTEAFRQMYLPHGEDFAQRVVDYHLANGGVSRFEKIKLFNGEWLGEEMTTGKMEELAQTFSKLALEGVVNAEEVKGAMAFLLDSDEYIKFVITGTPTTEIKSILESRKMKHFFRGVYGSPEKKGYWVKKILSEEKILPEQCVFVGDALADYTAAMENDVIFILRETKEAEFLFENYQGHRIKDMLQLKDVIAKINADKKLITFQ